MSDATNTSLIVYYDYTCRHSYRALHWLDRVREAEPGIALRWATFSLKEVNRAPEEPSWVTADAAPSISVLALALAHAARDAEFDRYHRTVFDAMQGEGRHVSEEDLFEIAGGAAVDVGAFRAERGAWVARVGDEHRDAVTRLHAYGTPTIVQGGASAYMRLVEVPATGDEAASLLTQLRAIAASKVDLLEVFRPAGEVPTPVVVELGRPDLEPS